MICIGKKGNDFGLRCISIKHMLRIGDFASPVSFVIAVTVLGGMKRKLQRGQTYRKLL